MRDRPFELTFLACLSVLMGIVSLVGGLGMTIVGSAGVSAGAGLGIPILIIGALYLALVAGTYVLAYGFWNGRHWTWAGGVAVFAAFVFANVATALLAGRSVTMVFPAVSGALGIWYLYRPVTRRALLGDSPPEEARGMTPPADGPKTAEPAR